MNEFPAQAIRQSALKVDLTEDGVLLRLDDVICGLDTETARQLTGWLVNNVGYYTEAKEEVPDDGDKGSDDPEPEGEPDLGGTLPDTLH